MSREQYIEAKKRYNKLGKRVRQRPDDVALRVEYEEAKREYHRLGEKVRRDGG